MTSFELPFFGSLDLHSLEEYYQTIIEFNGTEVELDLNFESRRIDPERLDAVRQFIENLPTLNAMNRTYIEDDFDGNDEDPTVMAYAQFHIEELGEDGLEGIVDFNDSTKDPEQQLMEKLQLVRVGLYPDSAEQFAIFDYSIGTELTNYLLVLYTDISGNLDYMTMES